MGKSGELNLGGIKNEGERKLLSICFASFFEVS